MVACPRSGISVDCGNQRACSDRTGWETVRCSLGTLADPQSLNRSVVGNVVGA